MDPAGHARGWRTAGGPNSAQPVLPDGARPPVTRARPEQPGDPRAEFAADKNSGLRAIGVTASRARRRFSAGRDAAGRGGRCRSRSRRPGRSSARRTRRVWRLPRPLMPAGPRSLDPQAIERMRLGPGRMRQPRAGLVIERRGAADEQRLEQAPAERLHGAEPGRRGAGERETPRGVRDVVRLTVRHAVVRRPAFGIALAVRPVVLAGRRLARNGSRPRAANRSPLKNGRQRTRQPVSAASRSSWVEAR